MKVLVFGSTGGIGSQMVNYKDIAIEFDLVPLTVAEPMPRIAIRLKKKCYPNYPYNLMDKRNNLIL